MMHDQKCEDPRSDVKDCRCEVRALEARLAEAERLALGQREVAIEWAKRAERAEALLAEWLPVVGAAVVESDACARAAEADDRATVALPASTEERIALKESRSLFRRAEQASLELHESVAALSTAAREAAR